ncbi:TELO2-interacting protein 1 homolog [Uranotaenia lowii]|uniref:TELO2-interacting protein 1 homolog n=1 Tax=Uranotaenia lowii TaxID=190385 RepID=UPI00247932B1|nr:TELO2-interacting protein 1 homolog [Uranotaenia lowii]
MESLAEIFSNLKPQFEKVIKNPNLSDINQLHDYLRRIDAASLQILQNVFLQQLVILVDSVPGENKNELKTALMDCVCTILEKTKLRQAVAMKTTVVVLVKQIYDPQSGQLIANLSEEFKLGVVRGLTLATRNVQSELIEQIYVKDNLNLISQVLFVCVSVLANERYRKLRFAAIECILSTMQIHDGFDSDDPVLRCQVAELLFIVLPKLLSALIQVINGDEKQGRALLCMAIKTLGRVLCLIFEDYDRQDANEYASTEDFLRLCRESNTDGSGDTGNILGMGLKNPKAREDYFNSTKRNLQWLLEAEKKVAKVLETIYHLRGAEEELVRLQYARMNIELYGKCVRNMPTCSITFLESLLALSQDDSSKVSTSARAVYENSDSSTKIPRFGLTRMDELLFVGLKAAPRTIYRGVESEQISHFRLLAGYISFLTDRQLVVLLSDQEVLNQLIMVLVAGVELDHPEELVRREYVSYRFDYVKKVENINENLESRWFVLKNFHSSSRAQKSFLRIIQNSQDRPETLAVILNYIMEDLFSTRLNTNGYLYLLSEMIPKSCANESLLGIFRTVLEEILQSYHWDLELEESAESVNDLKFNCLHICLCLRIVCRLGNLFRWDYRWQLYDVLKYALPLTRTTLHSISQAAEQTLASIASDLKLESIQQLIFEHLDYISQHTNRCLKRSESFSSGVRLLEAVLRFVPYESSAVLESTISPIVMNILDDHDQRAGDGRILCLRVLQIFIRAIRYRFRREASSEQQLDEEESKAREKLQQRIAQLKEELTNKLPPEGATIEEVTEEQDSESNPPVDDMETDFEPYQSEEEKLPPHIRITIKILEVNFKYLSSTVQEERIVALSTLDEGINLLAHHENQLLPLVHQIWFNFAERFADSSPVVLGYAFDLLITLARLAKDFIRKRTLDDVLPRLSEFMKQNLTADFSALQTYKLQRKILVQAPALVVSLRLNERQLDQVLEVGKLYLDRSERKELQHLAKGFFDQLARYDPAAVFVKLNSSRSVQ